MNVQEDKRVVIKCRDNETYTADAVIVTLPLGVLKANGVKFTPDLTSKKRKAIKRVGELIMVGSVCCGGWEGGGGEEAVLIQ